MKNIIAIRREDLSKKGEKRVAVVPELVRRLHSRDITVLVQPALNPDAGVLKRAFPDEGYIAAGAQVMEDISSARVVFGLKEIGLESILPDTTYLCFSHTHKGQIKNREMLRTFRDRRTTLMDYELMANTSGERVITAFTYYAGYAGMVDTLWTVGKRLKMRGINHPFAGVPQSIETEDLPRIKVMLREIGQRISQEGTPASLPPFINVILGAGKTSNGAQEIFAILPTESISLAELPEVHAHGDRRKVYQCVLGITDMFRLKNDANIPPAAYQAMDHHDQKEHYFNHPEDFESNLDQVLPYASILMNCILWSSQYPRTISRALMAELWPSCQNLIAIGDISCDPNGSIEFSKETWIDNPVFIYNPLTDQSELGFEGKGIAVMAVTNLPCEFSTDASTQFSRNLLPYMAAICEANYASSLQESGLPDEMLRSVILWKGEFTERFRYMEEYL